MQTNCSGRYQLMVTTIQFNKEPSVRTTEWKNQYFFPACLDIERKKYCAVLPKRQRKSFQRPKSKDTLKQSKNKHLKSRWLLLLQIGCWLITRLDVLCLVPYRDATCTYMLLACSSISLFPVGCCMFLGGTLLPCPAKPTRQLGSRQVLQLLLRKGREIKVGILISFYGFLMYSRIF